MFFVLSYFRTLKFIVQIGTAADVVSGACSFNGIHSICCNVYHFINISTGISFLPKFHFEKERLNG